MYILTEIDGIKADFVGDIHKDGDEDVCGSRVGCKLGDGGGEEGYEEADCDPGPRGEEVQPRGEPFRQTLIRTHKNMYFARKEN